MDLGLSSRVRKRSVVFFSMMSFVMVGCGDRLLWVCDCELRLEPACPDDLVMMPAVFRAVGVQRQVTQNELVS